MYSGLAKKTEKDPHIAATNQSAKPCAILSSKVIRSNPRGKDDN